MAEIEHSAEVLYLKDLRALETVRYLLLLKINPIKKKIASLTAREQEAKDNIHRCNSYIYDYERNLSHTDEILDYAKSNNTESKKEADSVYSWALIPTLFAFVIVVVLFGIFCNIVVSLSIAAIAAVGVYVFYIIYSNNEYDTKVQESYDKKIIEYNKELAKYQSSLTSNKKALDAICSQITYYQNESKKYEPELSKVEAFLDEAYSANIVPSQYRRNIQAIYYFYEFISTSNFSLQQAMDNYMHQEIANKLDTIISKMNTIIANQNEIIINQRQIEAKLDRQAKQNEDMLHELASIENNAALSAQYSKIAAEFTAVNTYFAAATYSKLIR